MFIVSVLIVANVSTRFAPRPQNTTLQRTVTVENFDDVDSKIAKIATDTVSDQLAVGHSVQILSISHSVSWAPPEAFATAKV